VRISDVSPGTSDVSNDPFTIKGNSAPVIGTIPDQTINEGGTFTNILLDNYVSDIESADANINWNVSGNNRLIVSIINRVATVTTPTTYWLGTDTITFVATDNDPINPLSSSTDVIFTVNDLPICYNETFTETMGTVTDNSGSNNYVNNMSCEKLIQTVNSKNITLVFTEFSTEADYDFVRIYNGSTTAAPLLGQYSGNSLPSSVTATDGSMLITFTTDATVVASGWSATYISNNDYSGPCINESFTDLTGTITDNSGSGNYVDNMSCQKLIQPAGVLNIVLEFTQFNTESGYDFVRVYNGSTTSAPLLGQLPQAPTPPINLSMPNQPGSAFRLFSIFP
jgi:hypothetical protein